MESMLQPPRPFVFENNIVSVTSGNLSEDWRKWKNSFLIYYEACELSKKDAKVQINILLHVIGEKCRDVYDQFGGSFKSLDEVLTKFDGFFLPKKNLTIERHKFFTREQGQSESVEQYVFELNKMAVKCEFKDLCTDLIRDRLICGILNGTLRERLLREPDLTLQKALEICSLAELSREHALTLKSENAEHNIHEIVDRKGDFRKDSDEKNLLHQISEYASPTLPQPSRQRTRGVRPQRPRAGPSRAHHGQATNPGYSGKNQQRLQQQDRTWSYAPTNRGCLQCGGVHRRYNCPAYGQQCVRCKRMNHYSRMCRVYEVHEEPSDQVKHNNHNCKDWLVQLKIHGVYINFKLDTGADVNVLPQKFLKTMRVEKKQLIETNLKLQSYAGSSIPVLGKCFLKFKHRSTDYILQFIVVASDSVPVLGRSSCEELNLVKRVWAINKSNENILQEFPDVFQGIGCLPGKYKIELKPNVQPVVHAPRKLPVALKDQIKNKLDEMLSQGIIAKVEGPTDWVSSMTVVKKPNGDLRLCLDPQDLNKAIRREHFKLPTLEEIISNLSGAKYFSTLDAKHGFWQVALHDNSTDLCTFNTAFGRYTFLRMPYGISSASEIFHKKLSEHFDDIEGVIQFIDDILIYGQTKEIHDQRLRSVLKRCQEINIKLNREKCKIGLSELKYLGHKITPNGIKPDESHVSAIKNMPMPLNVKDVERFLGLVTYVGKFVPNLSEKTSPLRELLRKDVEWHWNERHEQCFQNIKEYLINPPVLQYYNVEKPVVISVDSSKNGMGACILQNNLPVAYASRSLSKAEQSYAQIEKELLACVFACERFYTYIYGKSDVVIETDHKPLVSIINKPLASAPARLQRMLLRLQPYSFKLVYKPGKYLFIADTLSRAVAPGDSEESPPRDHFDAQAQVCALICSNPLTDTHFLQIQKCTQLDNELMQLSKKIKHGWPTHKADVDNVLKPYWDVRDELTLAFGIVWKGNKVVIPQSMRQEMLRKIHITHLGIEKCKLRAREIMYWPNMNSQLADYLSRCQACLTYRKQNTREPLISHEVPARAWCKVGTDIFHYNSESFLIVIDYFSKFVEIFKLKSMRSEEVINKLKGLFTRQGIPETVMSDNGPEFSSEKFRQFSKQWNFQHHTSSPGYAQSNGQIERAIQTIKNIMKKTSYERSDFNMAMLEYYNTPISSEIPSPAELLYNRKLRSTVPCPPNLLQPKIHRGTSEKLRQRQQSQKTFYDQRSKYLKPLQSGQKVKVRVNNNWASCTVVKPLGMRSYLVKLLSGNTLRRNRKHLIIDSQHRVDRSPGTCFNYDDIVVNNAQLIEPPARAHANGSSPKENAQQSMQNIVNTNVFYRTRFGREVRPPDRWGYTAPP